MKDTAETSDEVPEAAGAGADSSATRDATADAETGADAASVADPAETADDAADAAARIPWKKGAKKKRSRLRKLASRYSGYFLVRILHAIVSRLPLPVGRGLARIVGTCAYHFLGRERKIAIDSLTRVYGRERSPREIRAMARAVFRNMALTVVEWVIFRRWTPEKLRREFPETLPVVDRMAADINSTGCGAVGITAHCGNWELLSILFARFKPDTLVPVAQRVYFEKYNDFIHWLRTSTGLEVFYSDESARKLIRVLQEKKFPAFLPDQDVRTNSGVFVDFFGLPAYTVTFPVALARKFRTKMFLAMLVREGKKFKLEYSGLVDVPRTGDEKADLLAGTQMWTRMIEDMIRKYPEQWAWTHPRWRTSPSHPRVHLHRPSRRERETGA